MNAFKTALKSIRRTPYQALVAFLVTYISLLLLFCFSILIIMGNIILNYYETQPQLIAFFKQDISNEVAQDVLMKLGESTDFAGKIKSYEFISKEAAMEFSRESNKNDPLMLELITAELLPASVEFSTYDPNDLVIIKDALLNLDQIDEISYNEDVVQTFLHWTNMVRNVGLVISAVLLILTFLVMNVVIGMKVVDHRQSIKIMQIIGASKFYIRKPYLIEASIYGLISGLLAWTTVQTIIYFLSDKMQAFFSPIQVFPLPSNLDLMQLIIGVGVSVLICIMAAWRAVSRIVKNKS